MANTFNIPAVPGIIKSEQVVATAEAIADWQLDSGMIPWFPGGHADPWNHVEACMALATTGMISEAERGIRKLQKKEAALLLQSAVLREARDKAEAALCLHLGEVGNIQAAIITATQKKEALAKRLLLADSTAAYSSPAQTASFLLLQIQDLFQQSGPEAALPGSTDETRSLLQALCQRASDEEEAKKLAKAEQDAAAAEAAAVAAPAPTPVPLQPAPTTASTTAPTTTEATAPAAPSTASHARPPPSLVTTGEVTESHASRSSWPDGNDTLVPVPAPLRQSGLDQQLAILEAITAGSATAEQRAAGPAALESFRARQYAPY